MSLLNINNLSVILETNKGPARAVRNLSFRLEKGETLGIVGESGCGKSMAALALMGLLPERSKTEGQIKLDGQNLLEKDDQEMCQIRGNRLAMIFQEPMTSLNPVHTVGNQIMEPLRLHRNMSESDAKVETLRLLDRVGIPNPQARFDNYPHQLSGGQRQRVMIAIALSCQPDVLIADEPTTALDVTIQDQILDLIQTLVREEGMSLILISHDLGVISENTDNILVMYGGAAVETGKTEQIFDELIHPYTQGLFAAMPKLGRAKNRRLVTIPGTVPDLISMPMGCTFTDRCPLATEVCQNTPPPVVEVKSKHFVACHHLDEARDRKTEELFS
ncbi:ABC transporter ATP-binding protein [Sneathiella litorea]|uniref:ATP-binding cassette domain-containing protein n=1 Tax=Sneathiella litorea TaxID=2606216 RepID=A0A6L8W3U9_9PROT|nr:ABC transporter ATP-binding protein [Sneathiella litorea]MZR29090.1 ATP-binding cassette domain-containing protein [Sneathiella litorea]